MIRKKLLVLSVILVCVSTFSNAQKWSGILDPSRAIDWSTVGVGGIPARDTVCTTVTCSSGDMTSTIQNALSGCSAGQAVMVNAGTCRINSSLKVPSNVTLRGAGADKTILSCLGSGNGCVNLGSNNPSFPGVSVTGGATSGSKSITLSSTSGVSVGSFLMITELNDSTFVSIKGGEGDCTWCDGGSGWNGTRARGQIVQVTSVNGGTVGIAPGLYTAYSHTPLASPMTATMNAGVEDLQVYANNTGYTADFQLTGCAYCWLKGVEANYTDGDFVQIHWGYRDEIRDSYFSNAYHHTPGATDSDIFVVDKTTATLVENNIIERGHASVMINWGAAGNVISYNYTEGEFDAGSTNFAIGGIGFHGAHPQFNLMEGNVLKGIQPDQIWGSSSHGTMFRNWATGTTKACSPTSGRGTVNCSGSNGWWTFQASRAISVDHLATSYNMVGNVAGSANQTALTAYGNSTSHVAMLTYSSSRSYDTTNYNMTFGYGESSDDGSGTGCAGSTATPCHGTTAYSTAFLHGNYTNADGATNWASGVTHSLPDSFYLSGRPGWWKSSLPFPAIGPDVTGAAGGGGHAGLIPAQDCYLNTMGGSEGGPGSPLTFNASNCYGDSSSSPAPAAPSGLQVDVH